MSSIVPYSSEKCWSHTNLMLRRSALKEWFRSWPDVNTVYQPTPGSLFSTQVSRLNTFSKDDIKESLWIISNSWKLHFLSIYMRIRWITNDITSMYYYYLKGCQHFFACESVWFFFAISKNRTIELLSRVICTHYEKCA